MAEQSRSKTSRKSKQRVADDWTSGAHALAAIGPITETVVSRRLRGRSPFGLFRKLEDEELKRLAQALEQGWRDEQAAKVIDDYAAHPKSRHNVEISDLCRWIRQHPDDAESVIDCMSVFPPEGVSIIKVLSDAGSQKRVYLANWKLTLKEIVLKRLIGTPKQQEAIFERESQTHPFSMGHPNIIETHPLTNLKGHKFLAEERLPVVLKDEWDSGGVQEAANLLYDICKALNYIHSELHLVHGDIKPDNIGGKDSAYILLDFGICRRIDQFRCDTTATGSLRTRAPELFECDEYPDPPKVDVWAIAATVYKAITGRFFFIDSGEQPPRISTPDERIKFESRILRRIRNEWDTRVNLNLVPEPLRRVLAPALVQRPEDRATAGEMIALCDKYLAGFLRSNPGNGRITATEEMRQLLRYLPRDESLKLMPWAVKQVMMDRLRGFSQLESLEPGEGQEINDILARLQ